MEFYIENENEIQNNYLLQDDFIKESIKNKKIKEIENIQEKITDAEEIKTAEIMEAINKFFDYLPIKTNIDEKIIDEITDAFYNHFTYYDKKNEYLLYY